MTIKKLIERLEEIDELPGEFNVYFQSDEKELFFEVEEVELYDEFGEQQVILSGDLAD